MLSGDSFDKCEYKIKYNNGLQCNHKIAKRSTLNKQSKEHTDHTISKQYRRLSGGKSFTRRVVDLDFVSMYNFQI
jgi:hypothetical protein